MRLAVLGDSIAWGQGAGSKQDRLAPRLMRGLQLHGYDADAKVFAAKGARSSALADQVSQAMEWQPTLAVIVIGANDLTHLEPVDAAARALGRAVHALHSAGVEVVVAPAPDLSAVPHVPIFLRDVVRAAGDQLRARQVEQVLAAGGRLADTEQRAASAFASDPTLFSADRFHPSSSGYAVIADALLPAVLEAVRHLTSEPVRRQVHGDARGR